MAPVAPVPLRTPSCANSVSHHDASIAAATRWYADRAKLVVETSGAVTLAALQSGIVPTGEGVTVAVVSGGNVSLDTLHSLPD